MGRYPWGHVGIFLRQRRLQADLTQKQVADHFGLKSAQFVSNWERGICPPPTNYLPTLCRLFKISEKQIIQVFMKQAQFEIEQVFQEVAWKK